MLSMDDLRGAVSQKIVVMNQKQEADTEQLKKSLNGMIDKALKVTSD